MHSKSGEKRAGWLNPVSTTLELPQYKIDPENGSIVAEFSIPQGVGQAQTAGLTYDGISLWLSGVNQIYKINPTTGQVISSRQSAIPPPDSLAWDNRTLWVASFSEAMIYPFNTMQDLNSKFLQ